MKSRLTLTLAATALVALFTAGCASDQTDEFVDLFDGQTLNGWENHGG